MEGQYRLVSWNRGQGVLNVIKSLPISEVAKGIVVPAIDMGIEDASREDSGQANQTEDPLASQNQVPLLAKSLPKGL